MMIPEFSSFWQWLGWFLIITTVMAIYREYSIRV